MRRWWLIGAACALTVGGAPAIAGSQALAARAHVLAGATQTGSNVLLVCNGSTKPCPPGMSVFSTVGWILRLGVTLALLAAIHPALIALAAFAVPTVATSTWRPAVERRAQERGAQSQRLARHLFTTTTSASQIGRAHV